MPGREPFQYAAIRIVPRVERGELVNAGVVLFCRPRRFLGARTHLDERLLAAPSPKCDPAEVRPHLRPVARIAARGPQGGAIAKLPPAERFHWPGGPPRPIAPARAVPPGGTPDP